MILTNHQLAKQQEALDAIRFKERVLLIQGNAGTGKTTLINSLISEIKHQFYKYGIVYITAPTHKALSILKEKIQDKPYIEFKTIHSGLKLQRRFINGEQIFVKGNYNPRYPPFEKGVLLIIDEASMIGNKPKKTGDKVYDGMLNLIEEYKDQMVIIFLGDDKQLNPVNEENSPVFSKGYKTITLTEPVRQSSDNPILELAHDMYRIFRKEEKTIKVVKEVRSPYIDMFTPQTTETKEVTLGYTYTADRERIIDRLAISNGTNTYKYLAYTNTEVDKMNIDVRRRIYGNPKKIELEEILIFKEPFGEHMNNEEIKVTSIDIVDRIIRVPTEYCRFGTDETGTLVITNEYMVDKNKQILLDDNQKPVTTYKKSIMKCYLINKTIPVLHEDYELQYSHELKNVESLIGKGDVDFKAKYYLKEQLANLTYGHGLTIHKSLN